MLFPLLDSPVGAQRKDLKQSVGKSLKQTLSVLDIYSVISLLSVSKNRIPLGFLLCKIYV